MTRLSPRLLLVAFSALVVGAAWFLLLREPIDPQVSESTIALASTEMRLPGSVGNHSEAPQIDVRPERMTSSPAEGHDSERASLATPAVDREIAEVCWVEGRVIFPEQTPADEQVFVVAQSEDFEPLQLHRAPVGESGEFRVAFARGTGRARLALEARYLYLVRDQLITPSEPPRDLVLQARLGARIHGTVVLPKPFIARRDSLIGAEAWASGHHDLSFNGPERSASLSSSLDFKLNGLPPFYLYDVRIDAPGFAGPFRADLVVEAGRTLEVELPIMIGARVSGRVVDECDAPFSDVRIVAGRGWFESNPSTASDQEGRFTLEAIIPGPTTIRATAPDSSSTSIDLGDVLDGSSREEVRIILQRRRPITGRVLWGDGTPAGGCAIEYSCVQEISATSRWSRIETVSCDWDGRFEIMKLGAGPIDLTAIARLRDEKTPWIGRLEDVDPGSTGVVLTLRPGAAIRGRVTNESGRPVASASISASPTEPQRHGLEASTDSAGEFEFNGLHDGEWEIKVQAPGYATYDPWFVRIPVDSGTLELVLRRAATLKGRVVDPSGRPAPGARVSACRQVVRNSKTVLVGNLNGERLTDSEGAFTIDGIQAGVVLLGASARGWADCERQSIEVLPGETVSDLVLTLGSAEDDSSGK